MTAKQRIQMALDSLNSNPSDPQVTLTYQFRLDKRMVDTLGRSKPSAPQNPEATGAAAQPTPTGDSAAELPGEKLDRIEKEFISRAQGIGKNHKCFLETMRDDNALYVYLQPPMDFRASHEGNPKELELAKDFKQFRKELDDLAEELGCYPMHYWCDLDRVGKGATDEDKKYLSFLTSGVKKSTYKTAQDSADEAYKVGDRIRVRDHLRCRESGKPGTIVAVWEKPDDPFKGRTLVKIKMDYDGHVFQGFADSYIERLPSVDWKKDPFVKEVKDHFGCEDEYFPDDSYEKILERLQRETTFDVAKPGASGDTMAREIQIDAILLLVKVGTPESVKLAHEFGGCLMGRHKQDAVVKYMARAALVFQDARDDEDSAKKFACDGTKGHDTPLENCKAQNPMFCPYHGVAAMKAALAGKLGIGADFVSIEKDANGVFTLGVVTPKSKMASVDSAVKEFLAQPGFKPIGGLKNTDMKEDFATTAQYRQESGHGDKHGMLSEWIDALISDSVANEGNVDPEQLADLLAKKQVLDELKDSLDLVEEEGGVDVAELEDGKKAYKDLLKQVEDGYHKLSGLSEFAGVESIKDLGAKVDDLKTAMAAAEAKKLHEGVKQLKADLKWAKNPVGFPGNAEYNAANGHLAKMVEGFYGALAEFKTAEEGGDLDAAKVALHNMGYFKDAYDKGLEGFKSHVKAMSDNLQMVKDSGDPINWKSLGLSYPEELSMTQAEKDAKKGKKPIPAAPKAQPEPQKAAEPAPAAPSFAAGEAADVIEEPETSPTVGKLPPLEHDESKFPESVTLAQLTAGQKMSGASGCPVYKVKIGDRTYAAKIASGGKKTFLKNEMAFDRAYRDAGIRVPDFKEYSVDGKTVKLAEFIEGKGLHSCSKEERAVAKRDLLQGFPLDAAFSNWDVLGTSLSNVIVDQDGHCWRIDNGGAGRYDAHGNEKKLKSEYMSEFHEGGDLDAAKTVEYEDWDNWEDRKWPDEWRTMRRAAINEGMFDFTTHQIFDAASHIDFKNAIKNLPDETRKALSKPMAEMREMAVHTIGARIAGYQAMSSYDCGGKDVQIDPMSIALDSLYDSAKAGCREFLKKEVSWLNKGWLNGSTGVSSYTPVPYSTLVPEPPEPKPPEAGQDYAQTVFAAVKSVNYHIDQGDFKPNENSLNAALNIKPTLQQLADGGNKSAKTLLGIVGMIEASQKGGNKTKIVNPDHEKGFFDFAGLKTIANQAEIDKAKAELKPKHDAWKKEHDKWLKDKAKHDKAELKKAEASGAAPAKSFEEFESEFIKSNLDTNGVAQGGGDPSVNSASKGSQKHASWKVDACKKKVRQYAMMGISLDEMKSWKDNDKTFYNGKGKSHVSMSGEDGKVNFHTAIEFYKSHPQQFKHDMESYTRHKAMMYLMHSCMQNPAIDHDTGTVWVMREEHADVSSKYGLTKKPEEAMPAYPIDCSVSAQFNGTGCLGSHSIGWKLPMWRITDTWMIGSSNSEEEICINPTKIPYPPMYFPHASTWQGCLKTYNADPKVQAADAEMKKAFA